jgi:hypothetical protein
MEKNIAIMEKKMDIIEGKRVIFSKIDALPADKNRASRWVPRL